MTLIESLGIDKNEPSDLCPATGHKEWIIWDILPIYVSRHELLIQRITFKAWRLTYSLVLGCGRSTLMPSLTRLMGEHLPLQPWFSCLTAWVTLPVPGSWVPPQTLNQNCCPLLSAERGADDQALHSTVFGLKLIFTFELQHELESLHVEPFILKSLGETCEP